MNCYDFQTENTALAATANRAIAALAEMNAPAAIANTKNHL